MIPIKDRYHIIVVVGDAEQGKTTWMMRHIAREMIKSKVYKKAFTNVHSQGELKKLNVKYVSQIAEIEAIKEPAPNGVPSAILGIDQLHKYLHARKSMSEVNIRLGNVVVESRQHGIDIVGTTWGMRMLDGNIRKYVDLWVYAQRKNDGFHYTYAPPDIPLDQCPEMVLRYEDAQKWWDLFDTTELIPEIET